MVAGSDRNDAEDAAVSAGLRYVSEQQPGITRRRAGKGFSFRDPAGNRITDRHEIERLKALAIPPAWTEVWICPDPRGHLQATGRDARGRKQYRYHPEWRAVRDAAKFDRMLAFGRALPQIRHAVSGRLKGDPLERETVLAAVVRLLETTLIRIGNEEYARENKSYGLTTLRDRHVKVSGHQLRFRFRGKGGKEQSVSLKDRRAVRVVKALQDLPGQELFQYIDAEGGRQRVESADINAFLKRIAGDDFTAKDFRTWAATVLAAWALNEFEEIDSEAAAKRNIVSAVKRVARQLGNTPAVCRQSYIHPEILDAYMDGSMVGTLRQRIDTRLQRSLTVSSRRRSPFCCSCGSVWPERRRSNACVEPLFDDWDCGTAQGPSRLRMDRFPNSASTRPLVPGKRLHAS